MDANQIFIACVEAKEGSMVANQLRDWLNGDPFDEQNPNAMRRAHRTVQSIARGSSPLSGEARAIVDRLDDDLSESESRAEQAWAERSQPDDTAYRRDMIEAGRGHLLR